MKEDWLERHSWNVEEAVFKPDAPDGGVSQPWRVLLRLPRYDRYLLLGAYRLVQGYRLKTAKLEEH